MTCFDDVSGGWRKMYNKELQDFILFKCNYIDQVEEDEMRGACSTNGGEEERVQVEKPEGRRPLGRQRRWWADNIKMDLGEMEWGSVDWIGLAQDIKWRALLNAVSVP
jgi:hypothetical protein